MKLSTRPLRRWLQYNQTGRCESQRPKRNRLISRQRIAQKGSGLLSRRHNSPEFLHCAA
jgi:hypothetical protein